MRLAHRRGFPFYKIIKSAVGERNGVVVFDICFAMRNSVDELTYRQMIFLGLKVKNQAFPNQDRLQRI